MYDYEEYYEPTLADEIMNEASEKFKDALKETAKNHIEAILSENTRLINENKALRSRELDVKSKERELKYREQNLKNEVENEFYTSNIDAALKKLVEECEVWFADECRKELPKCNMCNSERRMLAKYPDGQTASKDCSCSKTERIYVPSVATESLIKFSKSSSIYRSERHFYFSNEYIPSKNSSAYDSYCEFKVCHIIDTFSEDTKEIHKKLMYLEKIAFKSEKECQKYCDFLNSKEDKP